MYDADAIGEVRNFRKDVARQENRDAALVSKAAQKAADLDDTGRIEPVGGLVQQQHLGMVKERAGEGQALLVAERQSPRASIRVLDQVQKLNRFGDGPARRCGEAALYVKILTYGKVRIGGRRLDQVADSRKNGLPAWLDAIAEHRDLAGSRPDEAQQQADGRGFSRAVSA